MDRQQLPDEDVYGAVARSLCLQGHWRLWMDPMTDIVRCLYDGETETAAFDLALAALSDVQLEWAEKMLDDYRENGVTDGLRAIYQWLESEERVWAQGPGRRNAGEN